jgi:hypothetical protein
MKPLLLRPLALLLLLASIGATPSGAQPAPVAGSGAQILVMLPIAPAHYRGAAGYGSGYDEQVGHGARLRVARDLAQAQDLTLVSEWPMAALGVDCFLMQIAPARPVNATLQALSQDARVAWAQALHTYRVLGHNDPLFALQPVAQAWHLSEIHAVATGRDVAVAVVDSGVDLAHPDLAGRVAQSRNFVDESAYTGELHGTAVAGILAANADDRIGIVGVAPRARLLALRACWEAAGGPANCNSFTLAKALQFALGSDARVINMSLTGPPDKLLERLLDAAQSRRVAVVCASDPALADGGFPASHPGVIAVAADDGPGEAEAVRAPGRDIPSTLPGARWGFVTGSSFAAAQVSGVVALMLELAPSMTPPRARELLLAAAAPAATGAHAQSANVARTDVCAMFDRIAGSCVCACGQGSAGATLSRR